MCVGNLFPSTFFRDSGMQIFSRKQPCGCDHSCSGIRINDEHQHKPKTKPTEESVKK